MVQFKPIYFSFSNIDWDEKTVEEQIRLRIDALYDSPDRDKLEAEIERLEARLNELRKSE